MAGVHFKVTGDANGYIAATRQAEAATKGMVNRVTDEAKRIDNIFKSLATGAGTLFTMQMASQFSKQVAQVRGEFQQLEVAFETMLQSKEKADALMSQVVDTAAKTPFDLQGVANGAKQLLAYGVASEEVNDTLIRLGDIAAGLSIPLNDLVYLYGTTMTQGRLFMQDLRQFQGRGIPLADELAKQFGVAKDAVGELVTAGKVGFPEVQKAIVAMTSEGGKFNNLMAKQSQTITGQISNLEDAVSQMFNEIGKASEGAISSAIGVASSLVENYEKIGEILKVLIVTYSTYKAAVIAVTAAQKAQSVILRQAALEKALAAKEAIVLSNAEAVAAAKSALLQSAQKKLLATMKLLNKTMLANPYVLAATAIAGVSVGLFNMAKAADAGQAGVDKYNKALAKSNEEIEKHNEVLKSAFETAQNEKLSIDERINALRDLRDSYSEIFNQYASEEEILKNLLSIRQQINEEDKQRRFNAQNAKLESLDAQIAKLTSLSDVAARTGGGQGVMAIQNQIEALKRERELVAKEVGELAKGLSLVGPETPVFYMDREKTSLKQVDELYKKQKQLLDELKAEDNADKDAIARKQRLVDSIEKEMLARERELNTVSKVKERIKELQEEQESLVIGSKEYIAVQNRISALQSKLPARNTAQKSTKDDIKRAQEYETKTKNAEAQKALREQQDLDNKAEQARINAMADGAEKRRAQIALDNAMELQQIRRSKEDYVEAYVEREKAIFEAEEKTRATLDANYQKKAFDDEDARARAEASDSAKQYDKIYKDTQTRQYADRFKAEINDWQEYLSQYGSYEQKKLAIATKYNTLIAEASTIGAKESFKRQREQELFDLEVAYGKTANSIASLFGDMRKKSADDLNAIADEGEKALEFIKSGNYTSDNAFGISKEQFELIKNSPEELDRIAAAILGIRDKADGLEGPVTKISEGFKELFASKKGTEAFEKALSKISDGVNDISSAFGFVSDSLASMSSALGNEGLKKASEGINSALSVVGETMSGAQAGAAFGPWGAAAGAAIGLVTSLVTEISKAKDAIKQARIDELAEKNETLDSSYEKLGKSIDKAYSVDASKLIEQQNTLLEQKKANLRLMIAEEKAKKNSDEEQIKQWEDEINGIEASIEDNAEKAKEAVNGISFDGFRDNFLDALLDMEKGAEGLADTIEEDIRKAMYEALLTDDAFEQQMRNLYNDLAAAIEAGDTREIDRIKASILNLYDRQEEKAREIDEKLGYEPDSTREASEKGVAQASQSSVDELNGRATAIQSHTFSINERVGSIINIASQLLSRVINIEGHTERLEAIESFISFMRSDISDILTKGIRVKA